MTSLAAAIGGEVVIALLIDKVDECFGLFGGSWVDMAQQAIEGEGARSDKVGRILNGFGRYTVHLETILAQ